MRVKFLIKLLFLWCALSFSQSVNVQDLKVYYTYSFADLTIWDNEENIDTFFIGLFSVDQELINRFQNINQNATIHDKAVEIKVFGKDVKEAKNIHVLFIDKDLGSLLPLLRAKFPSRTLFITDQSEDEMLIMINFTPQHGQNLRFEVNKANILNSGLRVHQDVLLYGGTELDVAKMYKESLNTLQVQQQKLIQLSILLEERKLQIERQQQLIDKQNLELTGSKQELLDRNTELRDLRRHIDSTRTAIKQQDSLLRIQSRKLRVKNIDVLKKQDEIDENNAILYKQKQAIRNQEKMIEAQSNEITTQSTYIESQQRLIFIVIIVAGIIVAASLIVYRAYKSKHTANQQLLEAQSKLVVSEKMASLGSLTAGIAHEINNPINYISSGIHSLDLNLRELYMVLHEYERLYDMDKDQVLHNVDKLKMDVDFTELLNESAELVQSVVYGAERTTEIVKSLRTFSRLDEEDLKTIDLAENIDNTLLLLSNKYRDRIKIIKTYENIPRVECYPGKINQLFMNVLSNAVDAIENNGEIQVRLKYLLHRGTDCVEVQIRDNGMGMSEKVQHKVFEPFYTTKEIGNGTGLGLSISYGIVQEHHGEINVESQPGVGTTFFIKLPVVQN